jgi:hypothetical protein
MKGGEQTMRKMRKILEWVCVFLTSQEGFAKLRNNPLGDPMGKFGNVVGGKWRDGIYWIRALIYPTQRGTLKDYAAYKAGTQRTISYKQMNIRRAVMQVMGFIGRMNLVKWIDPIWGDYITRHGITHLSGMNLMVKENAGNLYASMPNRDQEYNETTNAPDLKVMQVAKGDLEAIESLTSAVYVSGTGVVTLVWATGKFTSGLDTDKIFAMVAKKPILDSKMKPTLYMYGPYDISKTRVDGTGTFSLPAGLTKTDLIAFIFVKDVANTYGYSGSKSVQMT